ncbi:unnamed protein product, partial [Rodentolepis nana]|uniref:B5 domain-containing protein n=1 Tax=Rodentolepis nana TaxID=102285 RepID=A0A0R3TIU2_RODNA
MFSEYCSEPFTAEQVEIVSWDGSHTFYPRLQQRTMMVSVDYLNSVAGTNCSGEQITELLTQMSLTSSIADTGVTISPDKAFGTGCALSVCVPPTRHDVLHACDIAEDLAIAYGYNNIEEKLPTTFTMAEEEPLNRLTDMVRNEIALCGFTEALTFSL